MTDRSARGVFRNPKGRGENHASLLPRLMPSPFMCLPLCLKKMRGLSRRRFLAASIMATAGTAGLAQAPTSNSGDAGQRVEPFRFTRVVDLTHTLTVDFATGSGQQQLALERLSTWPKDAWNIYRNKE